MQEKLSEKSIAEKLVAAHDGDVALLYIYRRLTGSTDPEQAARDLCRTIAEVRAADEKLGRLLSGTPAPLQSAAASPAPSLPEDEEEPEYRAEEIARIAREDRDFHSLVSEASVVLGRTLSSTDTRTLFQIYQHMGLPADVLHTLLHYCQEQAEARWGSSRKPNFRMIQAEAREWARQEVMSLDLAEEYMKRKKARSDLSDQLRRAFSIHDRALTKSERDYIAAWLDMGFSKEAILIAYDRTVTSTGALKWPYMNKILVSWHQKGLHSPAEIEAKDKRGSASKGSKTPVREQQIDLEELESMISRIGTAEQ